MKKNIKKIFIACIFLIDFECNMYAIAPLTSAFGEMLIVQPSAIIQLQFPYNINTEYVNAATGITTTGSGTVTYSSPFAVLSTTAVASSTALLSSKARLHYQPGQACSILFTTKFTTGEVGSTQLIGVGNLSSNTSLIFTNLQDGFFFGYSGADFGILWYYNGTLPASYTPGTSGGFIPQSTWNVDKFDGTGTSGVTLDPTKGNVYKIQYQWLGFGIINFFIENPTTGVLTLVHRIQFANTNSLTTLLKNPSMQLMAAVSNTTNATNITMSIPSFCGIVEGLVNPDHDTRHSANNGTTPVTVTLNTVFNSILTIRNKATFQGLTNQVEIFTEFISLMNTSAGPDVIFTVFLNPTFGGALTYADVSTNRSVVEFSSTQTTLTAGTGIALFSFYLLTGPSTASLIDIFDYGITLEPNDVLCIAAQRISGGSAVLASISWRERF